jgi:hypothetical protein
MFTYYDFKKEKKFFLIEGNWTTFLSIFKEVYLSISGS